VSTNSTSLAAPVGPVLGATLADVLVLVDGFSVVSAQARQNMASGIRTLCRVLDRPPASVPIAAPVFRTIVKEAQPAESGLSTSRWRNVTSDVRRAIKMSGLSTAAPVLEVSQAWTELTASITDPWARSAIRGFAKFCSTCSVEPESVNAAALLRYINHLHENQLARDPARSISVLVRAWNKHVAGFHGTYEQLAAPSRSRKYALDWEELPASLCDEVNAFHDKSLHPDPLDPGSRRPVSPSTVRSRDYLIRQFAAALVGRGVNKNDLRRLADLFRLDRLKEGLRFFLARSGGEPKDQVRQLINLALVVGKRWAHFPADEIAEIALLGRHLRRPQNGLTEKNRARLRQFADEDVLRMFLGLSQRLIAKAKKKPLSYRSALLVQTALAIEILTFAPIRMGNLVQLDRQRHFHWARHDGQRVLHMVFRAEEVKNAVDLEYPLSADLMAMLDTYMSTYQPVLARGRKSSLLFPGAKDGPKQQEGFSRAISATIQRETGIKMNPHLFRHLAALLFLERHPGHYEDVRRILGDKRLSTILQNYAGLETAAAVRRYDDVVLARRGTADVSKKPKAKS
jgi:site-specific recombinase XerD